MKEVVNFQATARVIRVNSGQSLIRTYFIEIMPKPCTCLYFGCVVLAATKILFDFCLVISFTHSDIPAQSTVLVRGFPIPRQPETEMALNEALLYHDFFISR